MSLSVKGCSVSYGDREVLHEVEFTVSSSAWLAPIGPNGAGKSTLLRALAGLIASSGAIELAGQPLSSLSRRARARLVAYVPQRPTMPGAMTVAEYVFLGRTPHLSLLGTEQRADRLVVESVLERLELTSFANRPLGAISGGEAQRAVLGRALAQEASILLLDEPTASLDLGHQQQVLELVDELRFEHEITVVSAMHDLTLASQFATELALLNDGRIVAVGPPEEVLREQLLHEAFGAAVEIRRDDDGTFAIVPRRRTRPNSKKGGSS